MGTGWFESVNFHLERGSRRGWVELIIVVEERNTLVISRVVAGLARVVTRSTDQDDSLRPYGGLGVTETNLAGLGIGVGGSAVVSEDQFGLEATYLDPMFRDTSFRFMGRAFYNHAREFFGRNPTVVIECPPPDPNDPNDECDPDIVAQRAVVIYDRAGLSVGTGHDISSTLRYEVDWLGELVQVDTLPSIASTERGDEVAPIDFRIDDDRSYVSSLGFRLLWDRRDDPALPSRGQTASLQARFASSLFASTYDFARFEAGIRHWQPLPWGHVLSLGAFAGMVMGRAPFFYHFYAADLSDLLPSRVLGLNLDHRHTHNLLGTSIIEFDKAEIAGRLDFEYSLPLHRGRGGMRGVDAYVGAGVFMLAEREALRTGIEGYEGFERVPIDLTFDIGVQADTTIGLFKLGFSSFIGFLPDLGRE
jgi:outer membrane protein assembly factor BamA